jgi:hypothetical protein
MGMAMVRLVALAALVSASAVQASLWEFQYKADAGLVSGRLTGALQADGNTILVDHVLDFVTVGGVAVPSLPFVTTGSTIYGVDRAPAVTRDGSWLDFLACSGDAFCPDQGIGFDPDVLAFKPVFRIYVAAISPDLIEEDAIASRWSLASVPEPASWALLIAGFGLTGAALRRRSAAAA